MAAQTPFHAMQSPPVLRATTGNGAPEFQDLRFTATFRIGRAEDCELRIQNEYVSRYQAQVLFEGGQWRVRDLGSSNGIFVGDSRVQEMPITPSLTIRLGIAGPEVAFQVEQPVVAPAPAASLDSTAVYAARYFKEPAAGEAVGEHTQMVRRAFKHVQTKQKRKHRAVVGILMAAVV